MSVAVSCPPTCIGLWAHHFFTAALHGILRGHYNPIYPRRQWSYQCIWGPASNCYLCLPDSCMSMQWHPEKPPFEFSDLTIPHTHDAISVSQHLSNVFVDYARQSAHLPESKEEELAMLVYNYRAIFTARDIVMEPSYDGPDITCAPVVDIAFMGIHPFGALPDLDIAYFRARLAALPTFAYCLFWDVAYLASTHSGMVPVWDVAGLGCRPFVGGTCLGRCLFRPLPVLGIACSGICLSLRPLRDCPSRQRVRHRSELTISMSSWGVGYFSEWEGQLLTSKAGICNILKEARCADRFYHAVAQVLFGWRGERAGGPAPFCVHQI